MKQRDENQTCQRFAAPSYCFAWTERCKSINQKKEKSENRDFGRETETIEMRDRESRPSTDDDWKSWWLNWRSLQQNGDAIMREIEGWSNVSGDSNQLEIVERRALKCRNVFCLNVPQNVTKQVMFMGEIFCPEWTCQFTPRFHMSLPTNKFDCKLNR